MQDNSVETSESFEDYLSNIVQGGFLTMAVGMGVDTGLFEVMCAMDEPKTSQQIADLAGLKERYVREWLGAMVMAKIVDTDGRDQASYHIPPHRIAALKPGSGKNQSTLYAKGVPMLCSVYKDLLQCFKKDGPRGIDYSKYTDFHGFMAGLSDRWFNHHLIQDFIPHVAGLKEKLESGIQVLDLGCGNGRFTCLIAQHFPNSEAYGLDFSHECIAQARKSAANGGIKNAHFVCQDATCMDPEWNAKFDYIFVNDTLHDLPYPDKTLAEINRAMKFDGLLSVIDTYCHSNLADNVEQGNKLVVRYVSSLMNCVPVSLNFEGGMGLGANWGIECAVDLLAKCGFESAIHSTPGRSGLHYLCKKKIII